MAGILGLDMSSLPNLVGNVAALTPDPTAVVNNMVQTATAGVLLAGIKAQLGNGALDPLGIFHNTATGQVSAVNGLSITASQLATLPLDTQKAIIESGKYHIV